MTWGCILQISRAITIVSRTETHLCVSSASQKWLSLEWRHTFRVLSQVLMLKSLGLITLVLVPYKIERLFSKSTRAFKLPLIMIFIFTPRIVQNLFFDSPKPISFIESVIILLFLILAVTSGILSKISPPALLLHLSLLSITVTAVLPSLLYLKLNSFFFFSQTFCNNSTLDDSGHIPPTHPPSNSCMPVIKILHNDIFYALSDLNPQKAYGPDGVPPIVFKNWGFVLKPCLVKLFRLCLSTSTFPSCWKYVFIQAVPKKGDRSNPSNYRPIAFFSCLSKAFESILNRNIQNHLSISDFLSDRQYGFRKGRSAGHLLSLPTDSWSSSISRFGETFSFALDISKVLDRVWHKCLLSKLLSFGFYPSLCSFISRFLPVRSILAVVDGHCSFPKPINSSVPQGSVLSPTLFLLFISDLLSITNVLIHSYADDSTFRLTLTDDSPCRTYKTVDWRRQNA